MAVPFREHDLLAELRVTQVSPERLDEMRSFENAD
jgi:hypothetical protein